MAEPNRNRKTERSSPRTIGRIAATLLTAAMIIGTGIFGALGATADKTGNALLLAMIPGALVAWSTGISGAQLGVNFPEAGGAFVWARAFHHDFLGFIAGCCYLGQGIVGTGAVALAFAHYSSQIVHGLPIHLAAGGVVLVGVALNSFGISFTSKVVISLMVTVVTLLMVFVFFSLPHVQPKNLTPTFDMLLGIGALSLLLAAGLRWITRRWIYPRGEAGA